MVPEVAPVDLKAAVVERVDHLVGECVLHVLLVHEPVLAHEDTVLWRETTDTRLVTRVALHRRRRELASRQPKLLQHEDDHGA